MSFIVGIEAPIRSNENLYTLEAGKLGLFSSSLDRGARMSVIAKRDPDWQAIRQLALQALPADGDLVLLSAWSGSKAAMTASTAQMQRMRLSKAGWTVQSLVQADATLFVASLKTSSQQLVLPLQRDGEGCTVLLEVADFELATFAAQFAADLGELAGRELAPSVALIEWLLDRRGALGYHVKDDFNRLGLVLLGELTIPANLDALGVSHTYRDEEAGRVFQQSLG